MAKEKNIEKTKNDSTEKTDMDILIPDRVINKYVVKPWGLSDIMRVAPIIIRIKDKLFGKEFDSSDLEKITTYLINNLYKIEDEVFEIMSITVNDSIENIKNLEPKNDTILIFVIILNQNISYLKNLLGLFSEMIMMVRGG